MYDEGFIASCRTWSKIMDLIADEYGVPVPNRRGRSCATCVMEQFASAVREQCRAAAMEAVREALKLVAGELLKDDDDVLFVPSGEIVVRTGGVGHVRLESMRIFKPSGRLTA